MSALSDAKILLTPVSYRGKNAHTQQWQLDRARWLYQHARGMKRVALAELEDINAIRRFYASEGKAHYQGEIPVEALREPVGDLRRLGMQP